MRKFLFVSFLLCSYLGHTQVLMGLIFGDKLNNDKMEFGFNVGFNYSYLSNDNTSIKPGLKFGSNLFFRLGEDQTLHVELLAFSDHGARDISPYSLQSLSLDDVVSGADITRYQRYLAMPVMYKRRIIDQFYLEAGGYFALLTKAFDRFEKSTDGNSLVYDNDITDDFNRIDIGPIAAVSYRLLKGEGMIISMYYYLGLTSVEKDRNVKNRSLQVSFGIPIGKNTDPAK